MRTSLKTAVWLILCKFREILLELLRFHLRKIQRGKSGCVTEVGVLPQSNELRMPGGIFSSSELPAEFPGLHMDLTLHKIGER